MFIAFILSLFLSQNVSAQEVVPEVFHPHLTYDARPLGRGNFSFQTVPGMISASTGSQYGLLLGVFPRLDIGIMPFPYLIKSKEENEVKHSSNLVMKLNFWKGEEWFWTIGMSAIDFDVPSSLGQPFTELTVMQTSLGANYLPLGSRWTYGLVINTGSVTTDDEATNAQLEAQEKDRQRSEWFVDACYQIQDNEYLTLGAGQIRKNPFDDIYGEDLAISFGFNYTWERPTKTFKSPSVGLNYRPELNRYILLLSSGINF
ncbi:MAG: hypothetical protein JNM93_02755 [Bacteriovoracaceae bacterium]|nr:hypothetical protein [Bacteriovoracaceae bacterium]